MTFIGSKIVQKKLRILNTLPVRATVKNEWDSRAALTGRIARNFLIPRAMPWAVEELPFQGALGNFLNIECFEC